MPDMLLRMYDYLAWANVRVLEHLHREGEGLNEPLGLFAHILAAERIWLDRIAGADAATDVWPSWSLEECARAAEENLGRLKELMDEMSGEDLTLEVQYRNTKGETFTSTMQDILVHVVLHGVYHRGQIASSLREVAVTPVPTDFIVFAREGN